MSYLILDLRHGPYNASLNFRNSRPVGVRNVYYTSGGDSIAQIKMLNKRLGLNWVNHPNLVKRVKWLLEDCVSEVEKSNCPKLMRLLAKAGV